MYNVAILEDERDSALLLEGLLAGHPRADEFKVMHASTPKEVLGLGSSGLQIHILFADVVFQGLPMGIQTVREHFESDSGTQVIYVSGYLETSLDIYDTNHVSFLLKPVEPARLYAAVDRAIANLDEAASKKHFVQLKIRNQTKYISADTIMYAESNLRQVNLHTTTEVVSAYLKLDELAEQLPSSFVKCHRGVIVNMDYVVSLASNTISLKDGTTLPMSRSHAGEVKQAFIDYIA